MILYYLLYSKIRLALCVFIFIVFQFPANAKDQVWTEEKLGSTIIKVEISAQKKDWKKAIQFGELMLEGSIILDQKSDKRYINLLKKINHFYYRNGLIKTIPKRIKEAYILSHKYLGPHHSTSKKSYIHYYEYLIATKNYLAAIPIVLKNFSIHKEYKLIHYYKQLYSLYGLTNQHFKEEITLKKLIKYNNLLYGKDDEDSQKSRLHLARNLCVQRKLKSFKKFIIRHKLLYKCVL